MGGGRVKRRERGHRCEGGGNQTLEPGEGRCYAYVEAGT